LSVSGARLKEPGEYIGPPGTVSWVKMLSDAGSDAFDGWTLWPETSATKRTREGKMDDMTGPN
jgi:hypothetical protein